MKITVARDALAKALTSAGRLLEAKPSFVILANLLLRVDGDRLTIKGSNMDMETTASVPCEVEPGGPDEITAPGKLLISTVSGMPAGSHVVLEWKDSQAITLKVGKASRYRMLALPATDFPSLPDLDGGDAVTFMMKAKEVAAALKATEFAVARDASRHYLSGVHWHIGDVEGHEGLGGHFGKRLIFVATDVLQLGFVSMAVPDGAEDMPEVIVPERAVGELLRMVQGSDLAVELSVHPQRVTLRSGDSSVSTKLVDGTFPGYMRAIPTDYPMSVLLDVDQVSAALTRLMGVGDSARAKMDFADGVVTFSLVNAQVGDAEESIEVEWTHGDLHKKINAKGMLRVLQQLETDVCILRFSEPAKPIMINEFTKGEMVWDRTFLTMPMEAS